MRTSAPRPLAVAALVCLALACAARQAAPPAPAPPPPPPPGAGQGAPPPEPPVGEQANGGPVTVEAPHDDPPEATHTPMPGVLVSAPRARRAPAARAPAPPLVDKTLRSVRLFYGTNRARTDGCGGVAVARWDGPDRCRPSAYYGGLPEEGPREGGEGLEVGTLAVTFPPDHAVGKIERPIQVFTISLRGEDPDRDVVISELRSFADPAAWARDLRATGRDQAFVYVHGFETTFDQAARRAAQLAYDLDFDLDPDFRGVPMLFSWPSRGGVDAYVADYDASFESIGAFNRFLDLVKGQAGIRRVHVIAHSMGNRVVAEALYARGETAPPVVDQLVLAAPDIWASRFRRRFLRTLPKLAARVTLYVSDHDRALVVSSRIRKDEPRAGQVAGGLLAASRGVERFDAIDASTLRTDFLGHSYYANHGSMLGDIYCLLKGTPAQGRPLLAVAGTAWRFRPPQELAALDPAACAAALVSPPPPVAPKAAFRGGAAVVLAVVAAALVGFAVRRLRRRR
ncbi:MAG TPA: alpha/beta hydrolase [Thermoanaerobaculia bacterium]|nr:alpha/beta hydrolase [Thermoanaerobaculia bacterium]